MSSNNSLDLSIQLEENQQKSKEQELEEFVELTKKIAESDRNNDLLRQIKKNKMNEVHKIRALHRNALDQNQTLQTEMNSLVDSIKETKVTQKNKTDYYEQLSKRYDQLTLKEKQAEEKNVFLTKQNDNIQKKVLALQRQYEQIIKGNKEKSTYLQNLQKKKQLQDELINQSKRKIQQLEQLCSATQIKAHQLEIELKQRAQSTRALQVLVAEKERQAELFRKEKQESQKKQEQTKRATNKLVARIKVIEEQIDQKVEEFTRLQGIHSRLQLQIQKIEKSQDLFQQLLTKRREMVKQLKRDSSKLSKQKQITKSLRQF